LPQQQQQQQQLHEQHQQRELQREHQQKQQQQEQEEKQQQEQKQQQQKIHTTINGDVDSPRHPHPRHQVSLMQQRVRTIVPKLTNDMQKGQCGRIGIFGGCIM
jgi:hypothetical protein